MDKDEDLKEALGDCQQHQQPAKWRCGFCQQVICPQCQPVGYDFQIFHKACLARYQEGLRKKEKK
jgi:hypothetical protein